MSRPDPLSVGISTLIGEADFFLRQLDAQPRVAAAWASVGIDPAAERRAVVCARDRARDADADAARWVHEPANVRTERDAWLEDVRAWRRHLTVTLNAVAARPERHPWAAAGARIVIRGRDVSITARTAWFRQTAPIVAVWQAEHGDDWDLLGTAPRAAALKQRLDALDHAAAAAAEPRRQALEAKEAARNALRAALSQVRQQWAVARQVDPLIPPVQWRGLNR